jgi:hypothetical protein
VCETRNKERWKIEGIDERTSSPVSPVITDVAAVSHVAVSHASAISTTIGMKSEKPEKHK